ncbi:hypothetical protein GLO73106DRAFT_00041160, partial [Gloeocapsa sp. PCC 73106]
MVTKNGTDVKGDREDKVDFYPFTLLPFYPFTLLPF